MDNAEQSPRGPSKGIFDTASLLGIHGSHQASCKTSTASSLNLATASQKSSSKIKSNISVIGEVNSGKSSEKSKTTINNVQASLSVNSSISGNIISKSSTKKNSIENSESGSEVTSLPQQNSTSRSKKHLNDSSSKNVTSKNGKNKGNSKSKAQANSKSKEKTTKRFSSDSESHSDSSCTSTGSDSGSSGGVSSSASSESSDDEEREKQQKQLAKLKKQQMELRRKVQELKQASQESTHPKPEIHVKKTPSKCSGTTSNSTSKATKPVPTPAHSASATSVSPSAASPKSSKTMLSSPSEEDVNMSVPLDLCIKKQEPTFEVANTSVNNSYTSPASIAKKQVPTSTGIQSSGLKLQTGVKKRGRKPKFASSSNNMEVDSKSHNLKQNPVKELGGLQIISLSSDNAANSDITIHHKKNANSVLTASKPVSLLAARVADSVSTPRKNFTLDSLLSESNGTIDVMSSQMDNDMEMLPSSSFSSKVSKNKERLRYSSRIKKMEAKNKEIETRTRRETSSGTDSDVENDNSDTDDTEKSASGSVISNVPTSTSGHGHKRSYDEDGDDSPTKRKRILPDEKDIQIPLEHGWRRQTKIRCFSRSGVRGEVTYYAPCGKKLRNYPEVVRYLIKHGITDITRENFSFSTKINVGEFLESSSSGAGEDYVLLSEQEVIARIDEVRARKGRLGVQVRKTPQQRSAEEEEQQRQWEQKQLQHQLEQQAEEARRQKEHQRLLKQQERFERLEQLRIEREIRAQQLIEEQEMKRQQAVFLREQERERRRQHMMLVRALEARKKQEERERKREEILYEKRLNKEKKMEQRRMELDYLRELKKPVEDMTLKDTTPLPTLNRIPGVKLSGKAFADTLMVFEFLHNFGETLGFDMESLPSLNTMQMALLNLEEKCEEELLSVIHHLLVCVIEDPGVPNCPEATTVLGQSLKDADITNNNVSEILRLYFIAQDKGSKMCQCLQEKPFLSLSPSQKAEILSYMCNELLCSRLLVRQIDNNIETVNTLRKDKWIIEGDLRKLKTIQQRRALKLKQTANEENKLEQPPGDNTISEVSDSGVPNDFSKENHPSEKGEDDSGEKDSSNKSEKEKFEELENEVANESGNESDDTQATGQVSDGEDEEPHLSNEELTKKIDKLTKQLNSFSTKLVKACHTLRGVTFGQDRYHRRYWVLPKSGGIFVEGMESSELPQEQEKIFHVCPDEKACDIEKEAKNSALLNVDIDKPQVKQENENCGNEIEVQKCIQDEQKPPDNLKSEKDDNDTQIPLSKEIAEVKEKEQSDSIEKKSENEKEDAEKANEKKSEGKSSVNIFMPKFCDSSIREEASTPTNSTSHNTDKKQSTNPSIPGDQNWLLHSPFFASLLAGNMLFNGPMMPGREVNGTYFNLPKNDSNNPFGPFLGLPSGMLSAEQIFKSLGEKQSNQKPWFSILPRMPCDENSLIHTQLSKSSITSSAHSPGNLGMPNTPSPSKSTSHTSHSTPVSASSGHMAAALANLQMELLNGLPPGFFLHPYLPHQFGPTYQNGPPATNSSHQTSFTSNLSHASPSTDFNLNLSHPPASSTPSSIPTPSATPGPTSQGSATPSLRDSPSPSFAKRLVIDRMSQEHDRPKPVPLELRKGWWRITDSGQLKTLLSALHHRGIREKMLQKQIQKHFNYACTACSQGQQDATDLDIIDLDRQISQMPGGAPVADSEAWSREVALRVDLAILEQVENLEEKVGGASMQVKGWKPPIKISSDSTIAFFPACEQYLQEKKCSKIKQLQNSIQSIALNNKNLVEENCRSISQSKVNNSINTTVEADELDNKDESMKCENSTSNVSNDSEDIKNDECEKDESMELEDLCELEASGNVNPVEEAKKRLLMVEAAIERRYLRPPLGTSTNELNLSTMSNSGTNTSQTASEAGDEVHVPVGLVKWRDAVKACKTSSQLAMCLNFLESCTAWDKSIMRASCQFCHSGDNEDMLLLCDGCDKGYHTYCFKPKMEAIPEGDWYCYECLNKATGDKVCVICGKKGKLLECETCPKTFHLTCLEPPLSKMPKGKWYCSGCSHNKPKKSSKKNSNSKDKDNSKEQKDSSGSNKKSENSQSSKSKSAEKKEKKDRNQVNKDLAPCSLMVDELEKHDDAWPFLMPVNTKQFPTYRKVIKKPMDFNTIRSKLESGLYKSREDFVCDVRLIFDNCETFNEDDSPVGQAGHTLRAFFETRWSELCAT